MTNYGAVASLVVVTSFIYMFYQHGRRRGRWDEGVEDIAINSFLIGIAWPITVPFIVMRQIAWWSFSFGKRNKEDQ